MTYQPADPYQATAPPIPSQSGVYGQPQPTGFITTEPPPKRNRTAVVVVSALAVAVMAGAAWFVTDRFFIKDSGVAACEALRDGKKIAKPGGEEKMTEQQYLEARGWFEGSRHDDIRDHGTKLIDVVWSVSKLADSKEEGAGFGVLAFLGQITEHAAGLQSACADQGVIVDLQLGK